MFYQFVICITVQEHLVPILLVEVPGSFNGIVAVAQFQRVFRVAFHGDAVGSVEIDA
jgi:hypothetical protein